MTLSIPLVSTDNRAFLPHELRVLDTTLPLSDSIEEVLASRSSGLGMYFSIVAVGVRLTRAKLLKGILEAEAGAGRVNAQENIQEYQQDILYIHILMSRSY